MDQSLGHNGSGLSVQWSSSISGLGNGRSVDIVLDPGIALSHTGVRGVHRLRVAGNSASEGAHHILLGGGNGIHRGIGNGHMAGQKTGIGIGHQGAQRDEVAESHVDW